MQQSDQSQAPAPAFGAQPEVPEVEVGQAWADNRPAARGRTIRVNAIRQRRDHYGFWQRFALCTVLTDREGARRSSVGRTVTAMLYDFHFDTKERRTGYRLLRDIPSHVQEPHAAD